MGRLERDEAPEQLVVLGVADLRGILDVIEAVRPVHRLDELGVAGGGRPRIEGSRFLDEGRIHRRQRDELGHPPRIRAPPPEGQAARSSSRATRTWRTCGRKAAPIRPRTRRGRSGTGAAQHEAPVFISDLGR